MDAQPTSAKLLGYDLILETFHVHVAEYGEFLCGVFFSSVLRFLGFRCNWLAILRDQHVPIKTQFHTRRRPTRETGRYAFPRFISGPRTEDDFVFFGRISFAGRCGFVRVGGCGRRVGSPPLYMMAMYGIAIPREMLSDQPRSQIQGPA